MKRLLRSGPARSSSMEHQSSSFDRSDDAMQSPSAHGSPQRVGRSQSLGEKATNSLSDADLELPSFWSILDDEIKCSDPCSVRLFSPTPILKTTVYADIPLPSTSQFLQSHTINRSSGRIPGARGLWGVRKRNGDPTIATNKSSMYPTLEESKNHTHTGTTKVYYFETTINIPSSSRRRSSSGRTPATANVMVGFVQGGHQTAGIWPGEIPSSIGWGSDGLYANGRKLTAAVNGSEDQQFFDGDVIGCGVEVGGMQRAFFTRNGNVVVPPSSLTTFMDERQNNLPLSCCPVLAFQHASGEGSLTSNFGLDSRDAFRWLGNERWDIVPQQSGGRRVMNHGHSASLGDLPYPARNLSDSSRSHSPYSGIHASGVAPDSNGDEVLTRSVNRRFPTEVRISSPSRPSDLSSSVSNKNDNVASISSSVPRIQNSGISMPSMYGTRNSRQSLEDDDPNAALDSSHFNMTGGGSSSSPPYWRTGSGGIEGNANVTQSVARSSEYEGQSMSTSATTRPQMSSQRSPSSLPLRGGVARNIAERVSSAIDESCATYPGSPMGVTDVSTSPRSPTAQESPRSSTESRAEMHRHAVNLVRDDSLGVVANVASGELLHDSRVNSQSLLMAAKNEHVVIADIQQLLVRCKKDQEQLQLKLSTALEEADAIDNLEELFCVSDEICSAIEAGTNVLKRNKGKGKKKAAEGPSIDVLVENQDIFSLICMLRAPTEKRLQAALALMNFAKDDQVLSNEIRSSGGMHSFLTLFRTTGVTKELKVVASMAVAYTMPSFVTSSQATSSVGLKIMECLRFLVGAGRVAPNGVIISEEDMCRAASVGVNVLWINAILPLLTMERVKKESRNSMPALNPTHSIRLNRAGTRAGVGVFEQGVESRETQKLTESAVMLIAHLVKLTQTKHLSIDIGYDIVERVCEVDEARPIAVREGLLAILVDWIRSGDINKIRPSASALRYLISIRDKYMAGWIHSQVVNEGAIKEIVKLLNESVGHDVRVAVSQMLSALCVAPQTRAAVVDANCVSYLVALLYEHTAQDSEEMVFCAGNALLQLTAFSLLRPRDTNIFSTDHTSTEEHDVVTEILEGWAHGSFVQIAKNHSGKLRSMSVEALRVLSEDTSQVRKTRLQLCGAGAAEALGSTIRNNQSMIHRLSIEQLNGSTISQDGGDVFTAIKDTYEALRALANILETQSRSASRKTDSGHQLSSLHLNSQELLTKGGVEAVKSGGLRGVLLVTSLPYTASFLGNDESLPFGRADLLEESFRFLANLSPLLLSDAASISGVTNSANDVLRAFDGMLQKTSQLDDGFLLEDSLKHNIDALRGIMALASYEPLKIQIVRRTLPKLLFLKTISGERNDLSTAINQVLLSLGFTEDEITVQGAGNNAQLMIDWFCLQRALSLQAMARVEIRARILDLWQLPYSESSTEKLEEFSLIRQISQQTDDSNASSCESEDIPVLRDLFVNFTRDYDSRDFDYKITKEYQNIYGNIETKRSPSSSVEVDGLPEDLMSLHAYPLNDINAERDWILDHRASLDLGAGLQKFNVSGTMPERVEKLLDTCFPSKLLRAHSVPVSDFRPASSFNFRALMMPTRRYFSFRRESQLLSRLCDKQAKDIDSDDVHWTLGFTNSTFAGEFVESLVQTLYLCPVIRGLSFARTLDWTTKSGNPEVESDDGGGMLANLTGSLPPWVSFLTFDNILHDRDLRALVAIIDTMGKLSVGQDDKDDSIQLPIGQAQGKFSGLCIRNSPQINRDMWSLFFQTLGKLGPTKRRFSASPLSKLKILDLSGNKIGDEAAALVLELVHDKDSGCNLEHLDLSGNRIGRGKNIIRVLCAYTEYYRYNQTVGVKMMRKGWKSSLHTLILAENDLFLGQAGLEILSLLKHDALCLRYLDLSNNGLEGDTYQLLASSLLKNTALYHLNLSGNKFSCALINLLFDHLNNGDTISCLSFLLLENNSPALNAEQRSELAEFLRRSRKSAIERYINETQEAPSNIAGSSEGHGGEFELVDEETNKILSRTSIVAGRVGNFPPDFGEVESEQNKITVLFSAPLVFSTGQNELHPFAKLDFEMERELLWQCMKEASRDIEMSFDNAHHSRLLATVTRRCSVLHYSGHGHPSFLPFEDGMGGPNWLDVQDIKELILQGSVVPFKFVFVSACHSGLAGETFASAGVPHVVCCKQESELKDTAALAFTRSFYLALLVGHTVRESFQQGCKAVRATPNLKDPDTEMEKFVLLPKEGNHDVPVFRARAIREWPKHSRHQGSMSQKASRRRGSRLSSLTKAKSSLALGAKSSELSVRNMMQEDPSPTTPQFFLGREVDMYYIISALLKLRKRLITVYGESGIGRSSLASSICHYINERASTITDIQHIYFIKPKHGGQNVSCRSLLRQLLDKLEEDEKCRPTEEDTDTEGMLDVVCRCLKQEKCLIVFDRTELLEKSDETQELPMILSTILYETKQVKVMITARNALGQPSIGGQVEHPYPLGPLTFANSVKLFANLCPHLHTPTERGQLFKHLVCDEDQEDLLPGASTSNQRTSRIFSMIGNGIPAKIEKCAYSIAFDDLSRLKHF